MQSGCQWTVLCCLQNVSFTTYLLGGLGCLTVFIEPHMRLILDNMKSKLEAHRGLFGSQFYSLKYTFKSSKHLCKNTKNQKHSLIPIHKYYHNSIYLKRYFLWSTSLYSRNLNHDFNRDILQSSLSYLLWKKI